MRARILAQECRFFIPIFLGILFSFVDMRADAHAASLTIVAIELQNKRGIENPSLEPSGFPSSCLTNSQLKPFTSRKGKRDG